MLDRNYINEVIEAVREEIPEELRDIMSIEVKEVVKSNDEVLHGVMIRYPEQVVTPMVYIESAIKELPEDASMNDLATGIVATYFKGMMKSPELDNLSFDLEDIGDKLAIQVVEADRNRERLKNLVYRPIDNGMVMLVNVVIREGEDGIYKCALTKDVAESHNYDMDKVFELAMDNTIRENAPVMTDMMSLIMNYDDKENANPLSEDFKLAPNETMYVLSNEKGTLGATALYYPTVQERIAEALDDSYFVIPSSQHELIIVPERSGLQLEHLQQMVSDVNENEVDPKDVLSDRVLKFDRGRMRLIDPMAERDKAERGDR